MGTEAHTENASPRRRDGLGSRLGAVGIVLVGLAAVVALAALVPKRTEDKPPTTAPAVNITVLPIEPIREMDETFDLYGVAEPNRVVQVAAEVPGQVERYGAPDAPGSVREGANVQAGDLLVVLNKDLLQAEYDQAKTRAEFDRLEYDRVRNAVEENVATSLELERAEAAMKVSRAQFKTAEIRLKRAEIFSPADGVLDALPVEVGEYVNVGQCVARIVDRDTLKVVLDVPENDVRYLKVGQAEQVLPDGRGGESVVGKITFISELADEQTRTSRVEITVDNRDRKLRAGRIVLARLSRRHLKDVVMIPLRAVIPEEHGKSVYVESNGKAERRAVELGFFKDDDVRIVKGLSKGDRLIVEGFRYVAPDQPVRVISVEPAGAVRTARGAEPEVEGAP